MVNEEVSVQFMCTNSTGCFISLVLGVYVSTS